MPNEGLSAPERTEPGPFRELVEQEWRTLLDRDDRTSPAESCLITRDELAWAMCEAWFASKDAARAEPRPSNPDEREAIARINERDLELVDGVARAIIRARHWSCCENRPLSDFPVSDHEMNEARAAIRAIHAILARQPEAPDHG